MYLEEVYNFIEEMNCSTSSNQKIETIIKYDLNKNIRKVLYYTYNNFIQFNIKPKVLEKRKDLCNLDTKFDSLFDLLDSLNQRLITGHKAIKETNGFIQNNPELKDLLYLMLDRNLKVRVSTKLINKAIPGLIPTFNVALANKFDDKTKKKIDLEKDAWYVSRKLDGVRCIIVVDEKGKAKSFSRAGKQFHTLSLVEKEIENLGIKNLVFDGEMCIVNENGDEDFQTIMKEIGRKDHTIENGLFQIFDLISIEEFNDKKGRSQVLSERIKILNLMVRKSQNKYIKVLKQKPINSFKELEDKTQKASEMGWEGLMLRKDDVYKGKRSNDILKVKTFHDDEYIVKDVMFGPLRYVKEGLEVEEEMLSGVLIEHKGNTVRVGSGFSIEQRQHYFSKPDDILGKEITVQYFEESQNQNGEHSLRFPVVKAIHEKKRNF
jgi:DNA ligase-1